MSGKFQFQLFFFLILPNGIQAQPVELLSSERLADKEVFVDPVIKGVGDQRITVWFQNQFLGDGKAYRRRAREFAKWKRRDLRKAVVLTLKDISKKSFAKAEKSLSQMLAEGSIKDLERHWIVNGFTCTASPKGIKALVKVPGVKALFFTRSRSFAPKKKKSRHFFIGGKERKFDPGKYLHPWYTRHLLVDKVWKHFEVAGEGTLNVVHDFNFVFSQNLTQNLYRNPKEIAGNNKDDDQNGLVDDYHGFNFATNSPDLTLVKVPKKSVNPRLMHGFMCAAILCGKGVDSHPYEFGLAPEGRWAGVIAGPHIEAAVEWAIEQGADTYSMSFSRPNLGEYRSHWRKVMEHGSFCGVCFVSGAGNFARTAKIPVQMRVPEDIPNAVFAATGVQRNFSKTPFSSMGPVLWKTHHYQEGLVDKPEVCAFNMGLPLLKLDGEVIPVAINGNSFAGPMQGGCIALMLSADPELLPWDIREILTTTATDVGKKGFDYQTGHGLINCFRAVKEVLRRKAIREGKDPGLYQGREKGDALDIELAKKSLKSVLRIALVQPNGQGAEAGIKKGDILTHYNGVEVASREDLMKAKQQAANNKKVAVLVQRKGKRMTFELKPGSLGLGISRGYQEPVFRK